MQEPAVAGTQIAGFLRNVLAATRLDVNFIIHQHPGLVPDLTIEFTGPDTKYLTACDAELLRAIEHLATKVRGLEPEQNDLLSCDADRYREDRNQALLTSAHRAAAHVRDTGLPFAFPSMSSPERRQLHLIFATMGLHTASTGEDTERRVVLYPPAVIDS